MLLPIQRNNTYSNEFKLKVVHEYINDGLSLTDLVVKYNIPTTSTVNKWISKYLSGKILKTYSPKPEVYQLKYKSLTFE
ncbi:transposase, partial [Mesorhizobium sp. M1C.F.Ca.ET.204.01.1.1]